MQPIQPSDLFVTVAQMRDGIDTLIKRGKPATADELHQLLAQVKTQGEQLLSQAQQGYRITLNGEAAAKLIVPYMPTNTETARIMAEATATMQQTLAQGQQQTAAQVQQLQAIQAGFPRQVSIEGEVVGFTNWKAAALVAVVPLVLVLLTQAMMGLFSQVPQAKYDQLLGVAQAVGAERDFYQGQIQRFRKDMSTTKAMRQTTQQLFPPYVPVPSAETK
jgi:CRISPR/Cas system-associated exonuclease Cas4 (RecB family)